MSSGVVSALLLICSADTGWFEPYGFAPQSCSDVPYLCTIAGVCVITVLDVLSIPVLQCDVLRAAV